MVSGVNKRKEKDVMKLLVSDYKVQVVNEALNNEFIVKFIGPKDSPYEGVSLQIHLPLILNRQISSEEFCHFLTLFLILNSFSRDSGKSE